MTVITVDDDGNVRKFDDSMAVVWGMEDVKSSAADRDIIVNDQDAVDILKEVMNRHDCNYGISWDVINDVTDDYLMEV